MFAAYNKIMQRTFITIITFFKGLLIFLRPGVYLGFLANPFLFMANMLKMTKWISSQPKQGIFNDFYTFKRDYAKRHQLYDYVLKKENLQDEAINYLEFGVYTGGSFKWWVNANKNSNSKFYGFDTFEGLPENWGTYKAGEMNANLPQIDDNRYEFLKGLFQDTLFKFIETHRIDNNRIIIHLDADLFSSTLFVLTTLAKYLKPGDLIFFDEFNVPNHEFFAFKVFTESFYVKYELIGAVNNYYQVAFKIK
jgi:O-methyltransferase